MIWQSILGLAAFTFLAWALGERRATMPWKPITVGLGLQLGTALLLLKVPVFQGLFLHLNEVVIALQDATRSGTSFVFGYLGGGPLPFQESYPGASFTLAFQALPLILVVSALSAVLFHWRILPMIVRGFAWVLQKSLGVSGATGFAVAANIFVGMVEAPLLVKPYIAKLSRSDLFMVMTAGMATIAGTMMVLYASVLGGTIDNALGHILTASLISAPAAVMVARLMCPEDHESMDSSQSFEPPRQYASTMDAVTKGTTDGITLLINVIAMLIVMVALVALVNMIMGLLPDVSGSGLTLERLLGWIMAPFAWLLGVPWDQAGTAGQLLGTKVVLNEFIAYLDLVKLGDEMLDPRSRMIMIYTMCGFANLGSLGILIGGLLVIAPDRREDIIHLGPKSILSGMIAMSLTGCVIGLLY